MNKVLFLLMFNFLCSVATEAQEVLGPPTQLEKYTPEQLLSALSTDELGESYDPSSGSLSFTTTDISLPGNSNLKVELRRKIVSAGDLYAGLNELGNWYLDVPSIRGIFLRSGQGSYLSISSGLGWSNGKECSGDVANVYGYPLGDGSSYQLNPTAYWTGKFLNIPGAVSENLILGEGAYANKQVTKSNYYVSSCFTRTDGTGEGFVVTAPDGTRYTFDYVIEVNHGHPPPILNESYVRWLFATKVEDKFGNKVSYNYEGRVLKSIVASDGRTITLDYEGKYLKTAVANGRTWTYTRTAGNGLDKVILPDGTFWDLSNFGGGGALGVVDRQTTIAMSPGHCRPKPHPNDEGFPLRTSYIVTPEKLKITYRTQDTYHGVYNVKPYAYGDNYPAFHNINCSSRHNLKEKIISGPGISGMTWNYHYSQNSGNYAETDSRGLGAKANTFLSNSWSLPVAVAFPFSKPDSVMSDKSVKLTTITGPNDKTIYYVDRTFESPTENQILAIDYVDKTTGTLLKRVENFYSQSHQLGDACNLQYSAQKLIGGENVGKCHMFTNLNSANYRVNLTKTKTTLYDVNNVATSYTTDMSEYDFYGFPAVTAEGNSFSTNTRYTKQTYLHDLTNWVLGLPLATSVSTTNSGYTEANRVDYVTKSVVDRYSNIHVPEKTYNFGVMQQYFKSYYDDGTVSRIEFPNPDSWVEYSDYKGGIPQTIKMPSSLSQTAQYAYRVVDDNGWLRQVTDFKGNITDYDYDSTGRLTQITPFNKEWLPTVIQYRDASSSEFGISGVASGMQFQSITKGSYRKYIYYDALLRPLITMEDDAFDIETRKFQNRRYDAYNNMVFEAYPSAVSGATKGLTYSFDGLQRNISTAQDTANGQLMANTKYLSNNKIETTDFKNYITTTEFMAYGQPAYDQALKISSPESVVTSLNYNLFGNLTSVAQGGITQYQVYDNAQRLCKQVRPDIGNMAFNYNASGQLDWSAHSTSVDNSTTSCDLVVDAADKTAYTYDNLGNIRTLVYGDGTPTKTYTYDKNANLERLDFGGVAQVYAYDDLNNLTSESTTFDAQTRTLQYIYSSIGHLSDLIYPTGHVVSFAPNALGQATTVYNASTNSFYANNVKYHPSGAVKSYTYGNGLLYSLTQNQQLLPETIDVKSATNATMVGFNYRYDNNLNIETITDKHVAAYSVGLTYDGLNRLKTASGNWGSGVFNYDTLGNILNYTLGSFNLNYNYDLASKRLNSVSGSKAYSFTYDERANVSKNTAASSTFNYNLANQMTSQAANTYLYDGHNRRVKKQSVAGSELFMYSQAGQLLHTQKADGTKLNYIYLGNNLIAKDGTTSTANVLTDVTTNDATFETALGWKNSGGYTWARGATGRKTSSGTTPLSGPTIGSQGSSFYAFTNGYGFAAGNTALLESNFFTARNVMMDFDYHMYGANVGHLYVDVFYKGSWTTVWSKSGQQQSSTTAAWQHASVSLHDFSGAIKVRFRAVAIGGTAGDMGVDTVKFSVSNIDPSPIPVPTPPTVSISCNPCTATESRSNYRYTPVTVNVAANCTGSCNIVWYNNGGSPYSGYTGTSTSRTFTSFCGQTYFYPAEIWVIVTDSATGLSTTSIKQPVSMLCN